MKRAAQFVLITAVVALVANAPAMADDDELPDDFCYRTAIEVTNGNDFPLTDYGVRVPFNAAGMIAARELDARAWDLKPTTGGFSTEVEVFTQDLDSATAPWWFRVDLLPTGSTQSFRLYTGNNEQKRANGIFFTGGLVDEVEIASHADFDLADDIAVELELELDDDSAVQSATLLSRWDANAGYRLMLADSGGQVIRAQIDGESLDVNWDSAWTDTTIDLRMVFNAPWLYLYVDGSLGGQVDTTLGSATATSTTVLIGTDLSKAVVRSASIRSNAGGAEAIVGRWGFHAGQTGAAGCTETSAANPVYVGTCQDLGTNDHDATYTFTRDQTNITVEVGGTGLTGAPVVVTFDDGTFEILGDPFGDQAMFDSSLTENERFFGYEFALPLVTQAGIPRQMAWSLILGAFGLILCIGVYSVTRAVPLALGAAMVPPFFGAINSWIEPWVLVVWITVAVVLYGTHRWAEQS